MNIWKSVSNISIKGTWKFRSRDIDSKSNCKAHNNFILCNIPDVPVKV